MSILGIDRITYGVEDAAACRRFFIDWGLKLVHESGATIVFTLGTILAMLLAREPSPLERTSRLRIILGLGSAPIRDRIIERFGVADVPECYGSTDAGVVTVSPPGEPPRAGSAGKAAPGIEVAILDPNRDVDVRDLPVQIGHYKVAKPMRVTVDLDMPIEKQTWRIAIDGKVLREQQITGTIPRGVRVVVRGNPKTVAAIDNVLIWAEHEMKDPAEPPAQPAP